MTRCSSHPPSLVARLWRTDAPLTLTGLLMLAALVPALVGLLLDPRIVMGAPVWLKPAKFAISTAIYALTLAWVFGYLPGWPRTRRLVGWVTAIVTVLEVVIIYVQAWRGTTSHFNVGTPLDLTLWATMGIAIMSQTVTSVAVAVALWRQRFADEALGWALRLGLSITIVGAASGGLMTSPTEAQLAQARATGRMGVSGAHTVGAADGGPGLPVTGWSQEHGDLRVPHFLGLHAMQALPLLALAVRRRRWAKGTQVRVIRTGAASYLALFAILLWQALRGQSLVSPDVTAVAIVITWLTLTGGAVWVAVRQPLSSPAIVIGSGS